MDLTKFVHQRLALDSLFFFTDVYCVGGAQRFVKNHFLDMTVGCIQLLVNATFLRVQYLIKKNSEVRHSLEIVNSIILSKKIQVIMSNLKFSASILSESFKDKWSSPL